MAVVSTSGLFANSSVIGLEIQSFTFNYINTHPSYSQILLSLQFITFLVPATLRINVTVMPSTPQTATSIACNLLSNRLNYIGNLAVRYLVVDSGFNKLLIFSHVQVPTSGIYNLTSASPFIANVQTASINMTGTIRCFLVWNGINATMATPYTLQILTFATLNNNSFQIKI
jgi:hypothetical protein